MRKPFLLPSRARTLPGVHATADRLYIRSGSGIVFNVSGQRDGDGLSLVCADAVQLGGTLVAPTFIYNAGG